MEEDFFKDYPPVDGSFNASGGADSLDDPTDAPSTGDVPLPEGDGAEDSGPAIIIGPPPPADDDAGNANMNGNGNASSPEVEEEEEEEPEVENPAVTQWRSDFAKRLEAKMINERQYKTERKEMAKKTLMSMHQRWDSRAKDAKDSNVNTQKELLRGRDATLSRMSKKGEQPNWNIVPELADLSGTFREGARDTSRMRQVLLRMKTH